VPPVDGAQARGSRTSWWDPLILATVAIAIFVLHGFQGSLGRDLGTFVYGGEKFADGIPPYAGIFNSVGPLADMLPGAAIWLGGVAGLDPILSARAGFLVLSALGIAALYVLAVDVFEVRAAGWIAATTLLAFGEFLALASGGPREKTAMVFFLICGLSMLLRRRWFATGALVALATLTWQPALLPGLAAVGVGIRLLPRERLRATLFLLLGGAVPSVLAVVYFWSQHALELAVQGFVVINVGYTDQPSIFESYGLVPVLRRDYGPSSAALPRKAEAATQPASCSGCAACDGSSSAACS
jgi:hypothetical protein